MSEYVYAVYEGLAGLTVERTRIIKRTEKQINTGPTRSALRYRIRFHHDEVNFSDREAREQFKMRMKSKIENYEAGIEHCKRNISLIDSAPVIDTETDKVVP